MENRKQGKGDQSAQQWFVSGSVQGVGFRFFVQDKASSLGLTGWAENLDDGRVQVHANGQPDRLKDLEAALRIGPRSAHVVEVESRDAAPQDLQSFEIR